MTAAAARGPVTLADVARHAGVAPSTVSYVLSGKRTISAGTRQRVLASIRLLGYHPHAGARALASHRSRVLALVLPLHAGMHVPVLMQFAVAVVTTARRYGHDVLLVTADQGAEGLARVAASAMVDGLVLMDVELRDRRVPLLRRLDRPSVLIGFPAEPDGLTCVDLDFARAGAQCAEYLAERGHRCIALLGAPPEIYRRGTGFAERTMSGLLAAARRCGIHACAEPCPAEPAAVRRQVAALLAARPELTGLVVHNEDALATVLAAVAESGRRVPEDVSVVAICPDELACRVTPAVTSVLVPAEEVGARAVALLMAKLAGRVVPEATLLAPRLTERASTAARR